MIIELSTFFRVARKSLIFQNVHALLPRASAPRNSLKYNETRPVLHAPIVLRTMIRPRHVAEGGPIRVVCRVRGWHFRDSNSRRGRKVRLRREHKLAGLIVVRAVVAAGSVYDKTVTERKDAVI